MSGRKGTASVYIVGGAGTGKSTFTDQLLRQLGHEMGPLIDIHSTPNSRGSLVTLRGHAMFFGATGAGLYLGLMREHFPGTDGLDRVSSIAGKEWLDEEGADAFNYIVGEGATLSTRPFLNSLASATDLLLVHLVCDEDVKQARLLNRGTNQPESFVRATATRSANLVRDMRTAGVPILGMETSSEDDWEVGLDICVSHLRKSFSLDR
jgi:hypothetical protein